MAAHVTALPRTGDFDATLHDRTGWPRLGLRGPATAGWCAAAGLPFPEAVNTVATAGGVRVARLGRTELLVLAPAGDDGLPQPAAAVPGAYDGHREETWAWFRLEGAGTLAALSAMTSADLRPAVSPAGSVVQTRLAGLDAVLVLVSGEAGPAVDIFVDIAAAEYFQAAMGDRCPNVRQ